MDSIFTTCPSGRLRFYSAHHCAAWPYQVYLISAISRWNSEAGALMLCLVAKDGRTYSAPLIDRLNTHCRQLFGETLEENFRAEHG